MELDIFELLKFGTIEEDIQLLNTKHRRILETENNFKMLLN
jgi:hypothetical protein